MSANKRIQHEPAWLLHYRPFRDSSRILDLLTENHGRIALVSRGSRAAKSRLSGVLRPFLPLRVSWVSRSELGTLTGAEVNGRPYSLAGDALMSAYYVNELVLCMLYRHDPQPDVFAAYNNTIKNLASASAVAPSLRYFELELLRVLGYALNLDHDTQSLQELNPAAYYEYRVEHGPVPVEFSEDSVAFRGEDLLAIRDRDLSRPEVLLAANRLLRDVISFHLGGRELKSRKVLREMMRSRTAAGGEKQP